MSNRLELLAPAKINLFLHVTGRRPNGYHELQSVFQLVDWYDRISLISLKQSTIIRHGGNPQISPENDLVVRAAQLLKNHTHYPYGVEIHLEKNIPIDDETYLAATEFNVSPLTAALNGGEDYELVFTVSQEDFPKIEKIADVTAIGYMTNIGNERVMVMKSDAIVDLTAPGFGKQ